MCNWFLLQVSLDKGDRKDRDLQEDLWFELSSEALCNWMMFVRPAQNHLEQNLVAYQYGHHIYYTTIKNVEPKQELKVWHCSYLWAYSFCWWNWFQLLPNKHISKSQKWLL